MNNAIIKKWRAEDAQEFGSAEKSYSLELEERSWLDDLLPCESMDDEELAAMYRYGGL